MKPIAALLFFAGLPLGALAQDRQPPLDCTVLNEAVAAVSGNHTGALLTRNYKSVAGLGDTVFYAERGLTPGTRLELKVKSKKLSITTFLPDSTDEIEVADFLQKRHLEIRACRETTPHPVSYNALYDDRLYEEMGKAALSLYRDGAGYAVDIYPVLPLPKSFKMPSVNYDALASIVRVCEKRTYRNMVFPELMEAVPQVADTAVYHWKASRRKIFGGNSVNYLMVKPDDDSDFSFVFVDNSTAYHPAVRKQKMAEWVAAARKALTAKGIRIREAWSDNEDYFLQTAGCTMCFRYAHDPYDIHTANFILLVTPLER